jgi:aspartate-semialdehyde dehydrogenase
MSTSLATKRIVIAGASSLLGLELKALLEESRFAACDFRLLDEENLAGMLTEAGGEPAVVQPVEEDSFNKAWVIFFTGSPAFTKANLELAMRSGAHIIDLSGETTGRAGVELWLPNFGSQLISPIDSSTTKMFRVPSAMAEILFRLATALRSFQPAVLSAVAFQPVSSSAGKPGIEELESQMSQLLSFKPTGNEIYDTQVAFSMLDRFGPASRSNLQLARDVLRREVQAISVDEVRIHVQLLHAPIYYGSAVTVNARLQKDCDSTSIVQACTAAGFSLVPADTPVSNVSVAGETVIELAPPQSDPENPDNWWFWAAADNLRLPASNAVKLAEKLLA